MPNPLSPLAGKDVLDQFYLEARARLLELAAVFDRLDRGSGLDENDPRLGLLRQALHVLDQSAAGNANRAEQLQLLFSRRYDEKWLQKFEPTR